MFLFASLNSCKSFNFIFYSAGKHKDTREYRFKLAFPLCIKKAHANGCWIIKIKPSLIDEQIKAEQKCACFPKQHTLSEGDSNYSKI